MYINEYWVGRFLNFCFTNEQNLNIHLRGFENYPNAISCFIVKTVSMLGLRELKHGPV